MQIVVTGGAGYIGSHVVYALVDAGEDVVVVDDLSTGNKDLVPPQADLVVGDVGDDRLLADVLGADVDAVIHFAGSIVVPESIDDPLSYYHNNTAKTRTLIDWCVRRGIEQFVFSSTAAVYGDPDRCPVDESTPVAPINPYGRSKLMTEWMLEDTARATDLRYVALRYFNVAGADPEGRTGQSTPEATHLIKVATQTALGRRPHLAIFGTDYPTPDGTCIRDYIHVTDLADAHIETLRYLRDGHSSRVFNCGYQRGFSVRQVVDAVKRVSDVDFDVREAPRRPGDPSELVADATALRQILDWTPRYDDLDTIVETALSWERRLHNV